MSDAYEHPYDRRPGSWLSEVSRIFSEENVHYLVDTQGGVHFYFDKEFAHNQAATVAVLKGSRYANTLRSFEGALTALSQAPPHGKAAIRSTFAAFEGLFRLMFPETDKIRRAASARSSSPWSTLEALRYSLLITWLGKFGAV